MFKVQVIQWSAIKQVWPVWVFESDNSSTTQFEIVGPVTALSSRGEDAREIKTTSYLLLNAGKSGFPLENGPKWEILSAYTIDIVICPFPDHLWKPNKGSL